MFAVIIAGGRGTRFWPASRKHHPKQLLNIIGDHSMLQMTVDRLQKMKNIEDIFIVTGNHLEKKIKKTISGVKTRNIIVEPSAKNTAPAIALAALYTMRADAVMGVFPADHLIVGRKNFLKRHKPIQLLIKRTLVTLALNPIILLRAMAISNTATKSEDKHLNGPVKTLLKNLIKNLPNVF